MHQPLRRTRAVWLLLLAPVLLGAGSWLYRTQEQEMRADIQGDLAAIGQLKVEQVVAWRQERLHDAAVLMENPFFVNAVDAWLVNRTPDHGDDIRVLFASIAANYKYADVLLVSPDGRVLFSLSGRGGTLHQEAEESVRASVAEHRPVLTSLQASGGLGGPHMSAVAPLVVEERDGARPLAAVLLVCNARNTLYPIVQSWPTKSKTAETLLVRRDGDDVLFLNDLRHQHGAALQLRLPLSRETLPATLGVTGTFGIVRGIDYRGADVLSVVLPVPDSPWVMVTKIDAAEALAPLHVRSVLVAAVILGAMGIILSAVLILWQRDQRTRYEDLYQSEAALRASEQRYGITLRSIGDAVIATDENGNVRLLNPLAERLTGWRSDEAEGRSIKEVFRIVNEHTREAMEDPVARVLREGIVVGLANHTVLISRDGAECPIADSGAPIEDGGRVVGAVLVFRDTTSEREAERRVQESLRSERRLTAVLSAIRSVNQLITREDDRQKLIQGACECMTGLLGHGSARIVLLDADGRFEALGYSGDEAEPQRILEMLQRGDLPECARRILDSSDLVIVADAHPACAPHGPGPVGSDVTVGMRLEFRGRVYGLVSASVRDEYVQDEHEKRLFEEMANDVAFALWRIEAERARRELEEKYSSALATTSDAVVIADPHGIVKVFNPGAERMLGYSSDEVVGSSVTRFCPEGRQEEQGALLETVIAGTSATRLETERLTRDGRLIPVEMSINLQRDDAGRLLGSVAILRDISERREAERALRESERILDDTGRLAQIGGWEHDLVTGEAVWTRALYDIFGLDFGSRPPGTNEHLGYYPPEHRAVLERGYERALCEGVPFDLELQVHKCTGELIWCRAYGEPVIENGACVKMRGTFQDITARREAELAKGESERRILTLMSNLPGMAYRCPNKPDWPMEFVSQGAIDLTGYAASEISGPGSTVKYGQMIHPDDRTAVWTAVQQAVSEDRHFEVTYRILRKDGTERWVWERGQAVPIDDNTPAALEGFIADVTDATLAERELERTLAEARKREAETKALLDGASAVLESQTFEESVRRIFDACCRATGAESGQVALLSEDGSQSEALFLEAGGMPCTVDRDLPMPIRGLRETAYRDNKVVWENDFMESQWFSHMPEGHMAMRNVMFAPLAIKGQVVGVLGLANKPVDFNDNDARVAGAFGNLAAVALEHSQSDEQLRASEEEYRLLAENTADCIWVCDLEATLQYINPASMAMFGYEPEEMVGMKLGQYCDEENGRKLGDTISGALSRFPDATTATVEVQILRRDGTPLDVEIKGRLLLDDEGRPGLLQGVTRDVSERKQAEAERERLQSQLAHSQKMESVGQLAGGVAHDFNNMLQVILGNTELALRRIGADDELRGDLNEVRSAAERSADLTRQLLAFARKQTVTPKVMDLSDTVGGMLKMLKRLIGEDIDLSWSPASGLWPVKLDPSQVDQILANLCVNARDAIEGTGKVAIRTGNEEVRDYEARPGDDGPPPGSYVTLSVSDDGCGMDEETLKRIFEPFFTTKGVGRGTGLGLSTVYGIVRQNEGYVTVTSEPGRGTTFTVYLPRHEGSIEEIESTKAHELPRGAGEMVLVAEDETTILDLCAAVLRQLGYHVLTASSPLEALGVAASHEGKIDLLMTDVIMPEMNGRDLAQGLLARRPEMKVLYMSGYTADVVSSRDMMDDGACFIQKPFSVHDVASKVREALEGAIAATKPA